jgi:hypothetical protein
MKSPTSSNFINESINTKVSLNRHAEGEKRLTFNPDQYAGIMKTQQKIASGIQSEECSDFIIEKSQQDLSLDFGNIA